MKSSALKAGLGSGDLAMGSLIIILIIVIICIIIVITIIVIIVIIMIIIMIIASLRQCQLAVRNDRL